MSSTQKPAGSPDESLDDPTSPPPIPDEDGPHDVPDDKVIEKTLPSMPIPESGSGNSAAG